MSFSLGKTIGKRTDLCYNLFYPKKIIFLRFHRQGMDGMNVGNALKVTCVGFAGGVLLRVVQMFFLVIMKPASIRTMALWPGFVWALW